MKKCKIENIIATAALLGVLSLFGAFVFEGASKFWIAAAIISAVLGVAVALLYKRVKKPQVVLGIILSCVMGVAFCCTIVVPVQAGFGYAGGSMYGQLSVTAESTCGGKSESSINDENIAKGSYK